MIEHRRERIHGQMAGVRRGFRQTANGLNDFLASQTAGCLQRHSANQLRKRRTASHGRNASFREKADFRDVTLSNPHAQLQNVAASGILDLRSCVGVGCFAGVAGMLEVIEKLGRIHLKNCNVLRWKSTIRLSTIHLHDFPQPPGLRCISKSSLLETHIAVNISNRRAFAVPLRTLVRP